MKTVFTLALLVALAVVARGRLPSDNISLANISVRKDATTVQCAAFATSLLVISWEIHDYGIFKTARGTVMGHVVANFLAEPITGTWSDATLEL